MEGIIERNFEMMSGEYRKEQFEAEKRLREVSRTPDESDEKLHRMNGGAGFCII